MADCDLSQFDRKLNQILAEVKNLKADVKRLESGNFVYKRLTKSDFLGEIRKRIVETDSIKQFLWITAKQGMARNDIIGSYLKIITGTYGRNALGQVIRFVLGWKQNDTFKTGLERSFKDMKLPANLNFNLGANASSTIFTFGDLFSLVSRINNKVDVNSIATNFKKTNSKIDALGKIVTAISAALAIGAGGLAVVIGRALVPVISSLTSISLSVGRIAASLAQISGALAGILNAIKAIRLPSLELKIDQLGNTISTRLSPTFRTDIRADVRAEIQPTLTAITNLNTSLTGTINARIAPVLQAIANIRLDLSPVLNAIANIRVDLSPTINAVNNLNVSLTGTINARASAILAAIANIRVDLSPTINAIANVRVSLEATINARATAILNAVAVIGVAIARLEANLTAEIQFQFNRINLKPLEKKVDDVLKKLTTQIRGVLTFTKCDGSVASVPYDGEGLEGLESLGGALSQVLQFVGDEVCAQGSQVVPLLPGEYFEEFKVPTQLVLTFGTEYPTQKGSLWHMSLPLPLAPEQYDWCRDFEPLQRTMGKVLARCFWGNFTNLWTGGYFANEDEANSFFANLLPLSTASPATDEDGQYLRIYKGKAPRRKPRNRLVRCVRAVWVQIDLDTNEPINTYCWTPPRTGC